MLITIVLLIAVNIYLKNIDQNKKVYYHFTTSANYWHHKHNIKKESNNKLKEISAKNHSCYYFNVIIEDFDIYVLIDEKSYENIFVYNNSCKTLMGPKPLCIKLNKINGFIKGHDGTRYLVLFRAKKYDFIYIRSKYLIGVKSGITKAISHYYAKIKLIHTIFYVNDIS